MVHTTQSHNGIIVHTYNGTLKHHTHTTTI
uniref:Uncharacterized protein n=1 Tax=Amphimedon queenslandica TaxID=400682 RepID=A0A1X7T1C3_AMPQE